MVAPNENLNNENKEKQRRFNNSSEINKNDLLKLLAEKFENYINSLKDIRGKTLSSIWEEFINGEGVDLNLILSLKEFLNVEKLSWDIIKNEQISGFSTFGTRINLNILKKIKLEGISEVILHIYYKKIEDFCKNRNLFDNLEVNFNNIKEVLNDSNIPIENKYDKFSEFYNEIYSLLPSDLIKADFKKINVSLIEVLDTAKVNGLLTEDDISFIQEKMDKNILKAYINNAGLNKLKQIEDFKYKFLLASLVDSYYEMIDSSENIISKISNIFEKKNNIGAFVNYDIYDFLNNISSYIVNIYNNILSDEEKNKLNKIVERKCGNFDINNLSDCSIRVIKDFIANLIIKEDIYFFKILKLYDKKKYEILEKLFKGSGLSEQEISYIEDKLLYTNSWIKDLIEYFAIVYGLSEVEVKEFEKLLYSLFKDNKVKFKDIFGQDHEISFYKKVVLPKVAFNSLEEFLDSTITLEWRFLNTSSDLIKQLFNKYYFEFNGHKLTFWKKVSFKDKKNNKIIGYPFLIENKICIVDNIFSLNSNIIGCYESKDIKDFKIEDDSIDFIITNNQSKDLSAILSLLAFSVKGSDLDKKISNIVNQISDDNKNFYISRLDNIKNDYIENEKKYEQEYNNFLKEWNNLRGDANLKFDVGARLFLRIDSLQWPGISNNYVQLEITEIDKKNLKWKVKILKSFTETGYEGKEIDLPLEEGILRKMISSSYGYVYKFRKFENIESFFEDIKQIDISTQDPEFRQGFFNILSYDFKFKNGKLFKSDFDGNLKEIKYIGKVLEGEDKIVSYEIKFNVNNNKVILIPYGTNIELDFDLNTFLVLVSENRFNFWTKEDYELEKQSLQSQDGTFKDSKINWISLSQMKLVYKNIGQYFIKQLQKTDEVAEAKFFEFNAKILASTLGFLPGIGDIFKSMKYEAVGEKETKILKLIEIFKEELIRADDGKGANHGSTASEIIKNKLFSKIDKGKKLKGKDRYMAAGYLLYALEKGPSPYFRRLSPYAGKGYWVKALLGEKHFQRWKAVNQKLINQIQLDPQNETLRDELVKSEIFYIKDQEDLKNFYTPAYATMLEGVYINSTYSESRVEDVYNGEALKGNFYVIYPAWQSYVSNNRPVNSLGAFKALAERVENEDHYINMYKAVMINTFTGFVYNNYITPFREQYDKILRTYGYVIGRYAGDFKGIYKTGKILSYILKKKNISLKVLNPNLSDPYNVLEYLYGKDWEIINPIKLQSLNYDNYRKRNLISKIEKLWDIIGEEVVKSLDYTDLTFFEKEIEDGETKDYIDEYISNYVMDDIKERWAMNKDAFTTGYAPYFQNGIFNVPASVFEEIALAIEEGRFERYPGLTPNFWKNLQNRLKVMEGIINKDIYKFVINKFLTWFGNYIDGSKKQEFISIFKKFFEEKNKLEFKNRLEDFVKNYLGKSIVQHYELPVVVEDTLMEFVKFFLKGEMFSDINIWKEIFPEWDDIDYKESLKNNKEEKIKN